MDYRRYEDEDILAYQYRICSMKDQIGTWNNVADIINKELNKEYTESKYRKYYHKMNNLDTESCNDNAIEELVLIEKEKTKLRDERNEIRRICRETARSESMFDMIQRVVQSYDSNIKCCVNDEHLVGDSDLIVPISDLHLGINIKSFFNEYNVQIATDRMSKYLNKIINISQIHKSNTSHVLLLGDQISGYIHSNLRLENNENVIKQVVDASELISSFIYELSNKFKTVYVYSVSGNHSRLFENKERNQKGENLDALIPFYAKAKLQNCKNVTFCDNDFDESIISFMCRKSVVYGVHGDKDKVDSVTQKLTMMTDVKPDIIYMGHLHTNALKTVYNTKIVQSGCFSGSDNFCLDNRLYSKPEQAVSVITDDGLDCIYNVNLE